MGIFDLFGKKKALKRKHPACTEPGNADAPSVTEAKTILLRGSFSNMDPEYQGIGNVIAELTNMGFHLTGISTSGEDSGHDWTVAYRRSYGSFEEFTRCARSDYQEVCEKRETGSPHPDWDSTSFLLTNRFSVRLFALNDGTPSHKVYRAGWSIHIPEELAEDELLRKTEALLRSYE